MKKGLLVMVFFILVFMTGCTKTVYFQSRPYGYALLSEDYVAKGSFLYDSQYPSLLKEISLTLYTLPHIWAEITEDQAALLSLDEDNFIVFDQLENQVETRRAFVKYIFINEIIWIASQEGSSITYKNDDGISFLDYLVSEENVKHYIEALEGGQAYFLDYERVMLFGFNSIYDDGSDVYQMQFSTGTTNYQNKHDLFPYIADFFVNYDDELLDTLFDRAHDQRNNPLYKTMEYTQ